MHRMTKFYLSMVILLMVSQGVATASIADKTAIRELDREMVDALNARDIDRYLSFFADEAIWMPPNSPAVVGKASIRELVSQLLEIPDYTVTHHPHTIKVSISGDLAYLFYVYEFLVKEAKGETVIERGKDISVFEKIDGSWKLVIDMWNSDTPLGNESR